MRKLRIAVAALAMVAFCGAGASAAAASFSVIPAGQPEGFSARTSATQAAAAADDVTSFTFSPHVGGVIGDGQAKTTIIDLPTGLVGNPEATAQCRTLITQGTAIPQCPVGSQVGVVDFTYTFELPGFQFPQRIVTPLFNMKAPTSHLADLAFVIGGSSIPVQIALSLRPDDQGVRATVTNLPTYFPISNVAVTAWGVPAAPSHDIQRCRVLAPVGGDYGSPSEEWACVENPSQPEQTSPQPYTGEALAFLRNPTVCDEPKATTITLSGWAEPDVFSSESDYAPTPTGCDAVPFKGALNARMTTPAADSASGLELDLSVPQNESPTGLATSHLKKAVVSLPDGVRVNPSSAGGLGGCSTEQIGLGEDRAATCSESSKIGEISLDTPLLADPVPGDVYLGAPDANPFGSLIALYIVADLPNGQQVKLPGRVDLDPASGRLTTTFDDNPQLPFSNLHLELKSGSRAPLITPSACGTYTTEADLYPWARPAEPVHSISTFAITSGPNGTPCPSPGQFDPAFEAGTVTPIAGAYSPLIVNASRPDGSQSLGGLSLTLPKGLTGKLAGVAACSDAALKVAESKSGAAELASPSCPAASKVGTVDVGAGAGSSPFHVTGTAYFAGPYKGAPISLAVITPALAGPFDLGTVVVRAAAQIDPVSTQIKVNSDPIPSILQGIPLKVRSVSVNTDRPDFTLNPTSCDPMSLDGTLFGSSASKPVSSRFQVGACRALSFAPKLALSLKGPTHRRAHPALKAVLTAKPGEANIARAQVRLPRAAFIDNAHIGTPCTRPAFATHSCPEASRVGKVSATTPILDYTLKGSVYLRANPAHKLPDLVADLRGPDTQPIEIELAGKTDAVRGALRNTFEAVPDAPVTKFTLELFGGKKGLIELSSGLCANPRASVKLDAQSGVAFDTDPKVKADCSKK